MIRRVLSAYLAVGLLSVTPALTPAIAFAEDADNAAVKEATNTSETYRLLNLFGDAFERVRSDYVEPVTDKTLIENAINGMLTALDPHSNFLDEKAFQDMQVQTSGEFGGLGLEVTVENGLVKVVSPIDDTPAAKAGIHPDDYILQIDGTPVQSLSLSDAVDRMRGAPGTAIKLVIRRGDKPPFPVTLTRAEIKIDSVRTRMIGDVDYIRVTSFNEQTDDGVKRAIAKGKESLGKKLKGFVLDLRNNPGGLLDQAIAVSGDFVDKGEIVSTRARRPEDSQRFFANGSAVAQEYPVMVLINSGSASASEIVAGALQDHRRATLIGTKSFGKGSVQTIIPLPGHVALRLTTARYYTPSGRSIQAVGIQPDIVVQQMKPKDVAAEDAALLLRRESDLPGALHNDSLPKGAASEIAKSIAEREKNGEIDVNPMVPTDESKDLQLQRALALLHGVKTADSKAVAQ